MLNKCSKSSIGSMPRLKQVVVYIAHEENDTNAIVVKLHFPFKDNSTSSKPRPCSPPVPPRAVPAYF